LRQVLEANLARVRRRIAAAARRSGRDPDEVVLVAVTKSVGPAAAAALAELGVQDLGESRVEALEEKALALAARGLAPRWHLVGSLQRNKARRALAHAWQIHSVDRIALLETLERLSAEDGRRPRILFEVKLAPEATKAGVAPEELLALVRAARRAPHLVPLGLMAIAPLVAERAERERLARACFARLARLARELEQDTASAAVFEGGRVELSMGMSADVELAVEAGARWVRVGSALFEGLEAAEVRA
jgi:pyridoxal phosphate enzyme (YggS family)